MDLMSPVDLSRGVAYTADASITARIEHAITGINTDYERLHKIDRYVRGLHAGPYMPRKHSVEYKILAKRSIKNLIPLIIDAIANALAAQGYLRDDGTKKPPEWTMWQDARLDTRQTRVHREALESGHAYVTVLPDPKDRRKPVVRAYRAIRMWAGYDDPEGDEFPLYALAVDSYPRPYRDVTGVFIDAQAAYDITWTGGQAIITARRPHGLGVCPVIRFSPQLDLDGRSMGLVEPVITLQDKINQTSFNGLVAQHWTAHTVRYATGLTPEVQLGPDGKPLLDAETGLPIPSPAIADPGQMWHLANPDAKIGQLVGTSTKDFLDSIEADLKHMTALSQTPPQYLIGSLINLSAEALAAAESAFMRRVAEIQNAFGESWESVLRLCAKVAGDEAGWNDRRSQLQWSDRGNRSLAQAADAIVKLVQTGIPIQYLLGKVPGLSQQEQEDIKAGLAAQDDVDHMANRLEAVLKDRGDERASREADRGQLVSAVR